LKYNTDASKSKIHLRECDSQLESSQWKCVASSGSSPLQFQQSLKPVNQRLTRLSDRKNSSFKEPSSQRIKSYMQARSLCTSKVAPTSTIILPEKLCVADSDSLQLPFRKSYHFTNRDPQSSRTRGTKDSKNHLLRGLIHACKQAIVAPPRLRQQARLLCQRMSVLPTPTLVIFYLRGPSLHRPRSAKIKNQRNKRFKESSSQRIDSRLQASDSRTSKVAPTSTVSPSKTGCVIDSDSYHLPSQRPHPFTDRDL
jgi:hypothetical protein